MQVPITNDRMILKTEEFKNAISTLESLIEGLVTELCFSPSARALILSSYSRGAKLPDVFLLGEGTWNNVCSVGI